MDLYRKVRLACAGGMSAREAARQFGTSRESVKKMLNFSALSDRRRKATVEPSKLTGFSLAFLFRWPQSKNRDGFRAVPA